MTFAWLECLDIFYVDLVIFTSILGIAGAGAKISLGLYQTVSDIGSAGKEVQFTANDTNALWRVSFRLGGWPISSVSDAEGKRQREFRDLARVIQYHFCLPTRDVKFRSWAAFNVGTPHL